jgi:hypothetical protein
VKWTVCAGNKGLDVLTLKLVESGPDKAVVKVGKVADNYAIVMFPTFLSAKVTTGPPGL